MKNGPVLSNVLDWISYGERPKEELFWCRHISNPSRYNISLKKDPGESELSKREIELIKEIDDKYKTFNQWEMVDICHKILPEWENPGATSIPIQIEDILKAICKTDREITLIEEDIANLEYCDFLLSTGS